VDDNNEQNHYGGHEREVHEGGNNIEQPTQETKSSDPVPPPDLTLASTDILIIKYCGVTGVILALIIFSSQVM
jgi:hypothetical protein